MNLYENCKIPQSQQSQQSDYTSTAKKEFQNSINKQNFSTRSNLHSMRTQRANYQPNFYPVCFQHSTRWCNILFAENPRIDHRASVDTSPRLIFSRGQRTKNYDQSAFARNRKHMLHPRTDIIRQATHGGLMLQS